MVKTRTQEEIDALETEWQEYLAKAGSPSVGSESYIDLCKTFFYCQGAIKSLDRARETEVDVSKF